MTPRWTAFALWTLAGAVISFSVLDITSIGLFLLPISVLAVVLAVRRGRARLFPDSLGVMEGLAVDLPPVIRYAIE